MFERCNGQTVTVRFWAAVGLWFGLLWTIGASAQESSIDTTEAAKAGVDPTGTWNAISGRAAAEN